MKRRLEVDIFRASRTSGSDETRYRRTVTTSLELIEVERSAKTILIENYSLSWTGGMLAQKRLAEGNLSMH